MIIAIWIHVDDGVISSTSPEAVSNFKRQLCAEVNIKWCNEPLLTLPTANSNCNDAILDPTPFQSVIGLLAYLISRSEPDLAFVVNYLAHHSMAPGRQHWEVLDYIMGYILKTHNKWLILRPGSMFLNLWSNARLGGELKRPQSGFMLKLGDAPIIWASKRQGVVALSTCVTRYVALSDSTQHLV
ncbi:hypothetical protein O181_092697 [Austropuccinia psidii MF-1]|uniref:Reverse transcriptase Ty1/copia-type domain-containing protein n=1 Tax=Austropuccinia psidii MF-1 TaxID=1389203 RepID=A0A9Q3P9U4_9BASI|nr:hypothetical protein [Austropuccinia psidii MF-1]